MKWPVLYQAHPRRLLQELREAGHPAKGLADIPDRWFSGLAARGFDWVYLLGAWQTGPMSRHVSLTAPSIAQDHARHLPDWTGEDVCGSPFAIQAWVPHGDFGGVEGLARFRENAAHHGLRLMLDFVPNHVGLDHPWAWSNPGWFFPCDSDGQAGQEKLSGPGCPPLLNGKDPFFPPWPDTFQLNLFHPEVRAAQRQVVTAMATLCDGLRCDMAMLPLPDVFQATWGKTALEVPGIAPDTTDYWPPLIMAARESSPGFIFLAECYWDREWDLMGQGFDYCYDKRLYDRLARGSAEDVMGHLGAEPAFRDRCAHFLENHDEERASEVFGERNLAAAVINHLAPGLRFLHQGEEDGLRIRDSVHLSRVMPEKPDQKIRDFYQRLIPLSSKASSLPWKLIHPVQAWTGNPSHVHFVTMAFGDPPASHLVVVNYSSTRSQCRLKWEWPAKPANLTDLMGHFPLNQQSPGEIMQSGLFVDLPPWGYHLISSQ